MKLDNFMRMRSKRNITGGENEIRTLANHNYLKTVYNSTSQLFLYTETSKETTQTKESNEVYFEQMYCAKADFSKINVDGALEWYKKRRAKDERR